MAETVAGRGLTIEVKDSAHVQGVVFEDIDLSPCSRLLDIGVMGRTVEQCSFGSVRDVRIERITLAAEPVDPVWLHAPHAMMVKMQSAMLRLLDWIICPAFVRIVLWK